MFTESNGSQAQVILTPVEYTVLTRTIYHVPNVRTATPVIGTIWECGEQYNQFFGFYNEKRKLEYKFDGNPRTFTFNELMDFLGKQTISISPTNTKGFVNRVGIHFFNFARELLFEMVRREIDVSLPSRMQCLFASETIDEAIRWRVSLNRPMPIVIFRATGSFHLADAGKLDSLIDLPYSEMRELAKQYWLGSPTPSNPELLFVGKAEVVGFTV